MCIMLLNVFQYKINVVEMEMEIAMICFLALKRVNAYIFPCYWFSSASTINHSPTEVTSLKANLISCPLLAKRLHVPLVGRIILGKLQK